MNFHSLERRKASTAAEGHQVSDGLHGSGIPTSAFILEKIN